MKNDDLPIRIAFYGNNLNCGYFFVRALRERGIDAKLFFMSPYHKQEYPEWWIHDNVETDIFREIPRIDLGVPQSLRSLPLVKELYKEVNEYDLLIMTEDGPALFSELQGIKKIFRSLGADILIFPFSVSIKAMPILVDIIRNNIKEILRGKLQRIVYLAANIKGYFFRTLPHLYIFQTRQRKGIKKSDCLIISHHQLHMIHKLHIDNNKIHLMPFFVSPVVREVDEEYVESLRKKYSGIDILFFHPTRQFYLKTERNKFLKDNDKLLFGYKKYLNRALNKTHLVLVEKGNREDIMKSKHIIAQLGIGSHVEWIPEMPNKKLRSYYALSNVVVCDQFSPHLAVLGSIGRETSFFGRLLITSFSDDNRSFYDDDMPHHIFPAQTAEDIEKAMRAIESLNNEEILHLQRRALNWSSRHLSDKIIMERYIQKLKEVAGAT